MLVSHIIWIIQLIREGICHCRCTIGLYNPYKCFIFVYLLNEAYFVFRAPGLVKFVQANDWIVYLSLICACIIILVLACFKSAAHTYPINLILLSVFVYIFCHVTIIDAIVFDSNWKYYCNVWWRCSCYGSSCYCSNCCWINLSCLVCILSDFLFFIIYIVTLWFYWLWCIFISICFRINMFRNIKYILLLSIHEYSLCYSWSNVNVNVHRVWYSGINIII